MDPTSFFGLERTADPHAWRLPVVPGLCSGMGALFGGCGLGAAIEALEVDTGRPLVWATAQYLSFAAAGVVLDVVTDEVVRGHQVSQARAVGRVDGEEILTVNAALGRRELRWSGAWAQRPEVPPPERCRPRQFHAHHRGTIMDRLDMRLADARDFEELNGEPGTGRCALWVRLPDLDMSSAALAVVGDYVPFGIGQALGRRTGSNSLDNTLRVATRQPTEWILADVRVHAVDDGFGHGLVHLWGQDGTLLGTASQSAIVREFRGD
ncbi:MAG TPA: thioesterase family protein [Acidimicrobiia bacterium]